VAILLPQRHETAVAHVAAYKAGLVAVPLFTLFGEEALEFRLENSGARAIITDRDQLPKLAGMRERLPELRLVLCADGPAEGALDLHGAMDRAVARFDPVDTNAEDPAVIIYTSGTTGQPKGALHAHRTLLGHLPGVEHPHDGFPQPGDRFWTPADWAWIGGLFDVLLPAWHHGVAVVAHRPRKFDPGEALRLMARYGVRNVFMPPTALKIVRASGAKEPGVRLRTLASGGESLSEDLIEWGRSTLGLTINEFYGQTECNLVVGNGAALPAVRPGWTGTAIPGHTVAIIDENGRELPPGEPGSMPTAAPIR
jgi:acetyl-CoA synthetase